MVLKLTNGEDNRVSGVETLTMSYDNVMLEYSDSYMGGIIRMSSNL